MTVELIMEALSLAEQAWAAVHAGTPTPEQIVITRADTQRKVDAMNGAAARAAQPR
jgi:hypothetical protein